MAIKNKKALSQKLVAAIKAAVSSEEQKIVSAENGPSWLQYVAMLTGGLAALAGFLAVRSTTLTNDAIYESNQAVLSQTQASDAWAEYQADSIKARIVETQLTAIPAMPATSRADLSQQALQIRERQPQAQKTAHDKTAERDEHLKEGHRRLGEKDLLNYADLAAQLGIALASVAALSKSRNAFVAAVCAGMIGVIITAYVFITHYLAAQ